MANQLTESERNALLERLVWIDARAAQVHQEREQLEALMIRLALAMARLLSMR